MDVQKNLDRIVGELENSSGVIKRVAVVAKEVETLQVTNKSLLEEYDQLAEYIKLRFKTLSDHEAKEAQHLVSIANENKAASFALKESLKQVSETISSSIRQAKETADNLPKVFELHLGNADKKQKLLLESACKEYEASVEAVKNAIAESTQAFRQVASELTQSNAEQAVALLEKQNEILRPVVEGLTAIQLQQLRLVEALSSHSHSEKEREENILLAQKEVAKAINQEKEELLSSQQEIKQQFLDECTFLKKEISNLRNEMKEQNSANAKRQVATIVLSMLVIAGLVVVFFFK